MLICSFGATFLEKVGDMSREIDSFKLQGSDCRHKKYTMPITHIRKILLKKYFKLLNLQILYHSYLKLIDK
jgi:hypothetical protein